jgi:hypothetical protein
MWNSQALVLSFHMPDAIGIEELSSLFVKSSIKQFHSTCLSAAITTHKN